MVDEEEREEQEDLEDIRRPVFEPPATHTELFKNAMTPEDNVDGLAPRDFKVGNLNDADLYKVQFLLQNAKIFWLHSKKYGLNLDNLIDQIQKDSYIITLTSTSHKGKMLDLFTTFKHEIKREKIEPKKRRFF